MGMHINSPLQTNSACYIGSRYTYTLSCLGLAKFLLGSRRNCTTLMMGDQSTFLLNNAVTNHPAYLSYYLSIYILQVFSVLSLDLLLRKVCYLNSTNSFNKRSQINRYILQRESQDKVQLFAKKMFKIFQKKTSPYCKQ